MKDTLFGTDADNPPYRYIGLSPQVHMQVEKVRENWYTYKEENGYRYLRCESNGHTWFDREMIVDKKRQEE